ncbi:MAG: D-tyrosyl-tRNA(Tyr) deacylase [Deltaproteobacteria bacterium]|jgi:D-tyrosyl-tRNA(Tyr) deacylase|nr:D-tyrosyl-tRNA(Tyr) deacylase [Deltaproteobacteria bacterium]
MKALIQRVTRARVTEGGEPLGAIAKGLLVFLGVAAADTEANAAKLAAKVVGLRLFDDKDGFMNLSAADVGAEMLVVSQFTLLADTRRGRRPSWSAAAPPEKAEALYELFASECARTLHVEKGRFRAMMEVELVNDGPVTLMVEDPPREP